SASMAPGDAPMTTAAGCSGVGRESVMGSVFLIDALFAVEVRKSCGVAGEAEAFFGADAEEALSHERIVEEADGAVLEIAVEVDENVAAGDQVGFREDGVRHEAVIRKNGAFA